MRIAILASGNGSNFEAIVRAIRDENLPVEVVGLFSDCAHAYVLKRAKKLNVPTIHFGINDFESKIAYETALRDLFLGQNVDYIILAGYMKIIGATLLEAFPNQIINIHPSLLPSFPGLYGVQDALAYGVKVTGVTVHYIDAGVDTGPIIAQKAVPILPEDTLTTLTEKIHKVEHQIYPNVIKELADKEWTKHNEKKSIDQCI